MQTAGLRRGEIRASKDIVCCYSQLGRWPKLQDAVYTTLYRVPKRTGGARLATVSGGDGRVYKEYLTIRMAVAP
jgi:hypothetical protein